MKLLTWHFCRRNCQNRYGIAVRFLWLTGPPTEGKEKKLHIIRMTRVVCDRLGSLTLFTIQIKCLFQEMWERELRWDENFPTDLTRKLQQLCSELPQPCPLSISQWHRTNVQLQNSQTIKLYVFCDSSEGRKKRWRNNERHPSPGWTLPH